MPPRSLALPALLTLAALAAADGPKAKLPPPADRKVDFVKDVEPILARCAKDLPAHMVPREIEYVDELPRSPNGKVDYKLLKSQRVPVQGSK